MKTVGRNYNIDILRLICSFLVITLHYPLPGRFGDIELVLARAAVPVYFMISGYFIYDNDRQKCEKKIIKQIKYIGVLCIYSIVFYLIYNLFYAMSAGRTVKEYIYSLLIIKNILKAVILNHSSVCVILWFMYSLLYATLSMYLINKYNLYKVVYTLIPVLLGANLFFGCYSLFTIQTSLQPEYIRNFWLTGLPYYLTGNYMGSHKLPKIKKKWYIGLFVGLYMVQRMEIMFLAKLRMESYYEHFIGTILIAFALFLFAVSYPGKKNLISRLGRKYSFYIYILQMAIGGIILKIYPACRYSAIYIFIIGLIISIIYVKIKEMVK